MEWNYAPAESLKWWKRGEYQVSSRWNGITHFLEMMRSVFNQQLCNGITYLLRIQIEVSIE